MRLERLARGFCELRNRYRSLKTEGSLTTLVEAAMQQALQRLDDQIPALQADGCEEVPHLAVPLGFEMPEPASQLG